MSAPVVPARRRPSLEQLRAALRARDPHLAGLLDALTAAEDHRALWGGADPEGYQAYVRPVARARRALVAALLDRAPGVGA